MTIGNAEWRAIANAVGACAPRALAYDAAHRCWSERMHEAIAQHKKVVLALARTLYFSNPRGFHAGEFIRLCGVRPTDEDVESVQQRLR